MKENEELAQELKELRLEVAKLNRRYQMGSALVRGIVSGLGSIIGATVVVGIIAYVLRRVDVVPVIGDWLSQITERVVENLSR